jgi:hypothetical protein
VFDKGMIYKVPMKRGNYFLPFCFIPLSQETGSYPIIILVYDYTGGTPAMKTLTYNVRVKYVPGRGDGFGWETWKD